MCVSGKEGEARAPLLSRRLSFTTYSLNVECCFLRALPLHSFLFFFVKRILRSVLPVFPQFNPYQMRANTGVSTLLKVWRTHLIDRFHEILCDTHIE